MTDGWQRDLYAKMIVDASGRRCFLANQLKMKKKDRSFNQFCIYSWFQNVTEPPERYKGFTLFYFLGLNQGWTWHIPLRNGNTSLGIVVDKIGRSSVVYRVGLFQGTGDQAAAEGRFVHVYVDNTDPARPVAPIPDEIRAAVTPLLRPAE